MSSRKKSRLAWREAAFRGVSVLQLIWVCGVAGAAPPEVRIQFLDSETGCRVEPARVALETVETSPARQTTVTDESGQAELKLPAESGHHRLQISTPGYAPMIAELTTDGTEPRTVRVWLDPLERPPELRTETIRSWHRPDAMVLLGMVVDEASSKPLAGVRVSCQPLPQEADPLAFETWTDARGFFQMLLPVSDETRPDKPSATLTFAHAGYQTQQLRQIDLWPGGDWTFRVRLSPESNAPTPIQSERAPSQSLAGTTATATMAPAPERPGSEPDLLPSREEVSRQTTLSAPDRSAIRVPRAIRVLKPDGTVIDYVSLEYYCRRVLPSEWIASWAAYPGGGEALKAGAVVVRTYAVGAINKPRTSTYDICGTTACQVYGPATSTYTDAAVGETAGQVLVPPGGTIPAALTEYSAENNSLGLSCGDGFTAPTGSCLFDPVCAGEARNGHGRGLCQWGSAKWATGLKFPGNSTRDHTTLNGFPRRDWRWILEHYYPALQLAQGAPLVVGDEVTARTGLNVRACPGGTISNGINCPALVTESAGARGVIVGGPTLVNSDGAGYTWFQVRWADVTGWSVENYLERVLPPPSPPTGLVVSGATTNRIDLAWADTSDVEAGFKIERAPGAAGPWTQIAVTGPNLTRHSDMSVYPSSRWCYRVKAFNATGESAPSESVSADALGLPPELQPLADQLVFEGTTLTVPAQAVAPDFVHLITDFESYPSQSANGAVLFRQPSFSTATRSFLATGPDLAVVTDVFPPGGQGGARALQVSWAFGSSPAAWLRLTTAEAPVFPNPVIDLKASLRFDLCADRRVGIAVGVRAPNVPPGTALGSDGGPSGAVQWVGVTEVLSGQPQPARSVARGQWTTCIFSFTSEQVSASGLGVLDHLALVPLDGLGVYTVYLDNVAVLGPKSLTYSLAPGAPQGAAIDPAQGVLTWTPGSQDAGQTQAITLRVTDDGQPPLSASRTFHVTVLRRPSLQADLAGKQLRLSWVSAPGVTYRVQFKARLNDPVWADGSPDLSVPGAEASFTVPADTSHGFYRLLIVK